MATRSSGPSTSTARCWPPRPPRRRAVVSATDPYAPAAPRAWSASLGLDCDILSAVGHITPADGYGPWPGVLEWCLRGRPPVPAVTPP
ncbi:alpha/beta hydrolase [Streptomyces coelicoflavus]|uniref:alpha/beta hydrolase n=1 Tax=Streptomyces coelicoflavus TaxID=285562 RepID=UPI00365A7022